MNEQTPKKILFNKSIFLNLKAELQKKQEEVEEKKRLPQHKVENFKPHPKVKDKLKKDETKRSFRDNLKAVDTDELEACRKSKLALEKKAELYEHLSDATGQSQLADRFLVNFKEKNDQKTDNPETEEPEHTDEAILEDESEWTEFTDFLGRTRKCLKSDLEYYKKRNEDLIRVVTKHAEDQNTDKALESSQKTEKSLLVEKTNDYLQSLRQKWEQKEREMLAKDKDIHYQDLLFDEARMHGVSYYSFSTDETERKQQMEELLKQREETLRAQKQAEEVRKKRDELIAARVAAARARQRARAGLPPEDPEEKQKDFTTCLLKFLTEQKNAADAKAKEEEKKAKEELEKERQKLRDAYVREWDIGKEGVDGKLKKFREMTQEEYVEQQRAKRIEEFAPIQTDTSTSNKSNYTFDIKGRKQNEEKQEKTWTDVRRVPTPPPPVIGDISDETKGLYFTTKTSEKVFKYKNFVQTQEPVPIENEIEIENDLENNKKERLSNVSAEIEPPATFDYYGPVSKQRKIQKPFDSNMYEAFAQGSKSLEHRDSNRKIPTKYDFTFD